MAKIPFDMVGTYIVMDVRINDNPPLRLLLDSGIENTLITELTNEDSLVLDRSVETRLRGLGDGGGIQAWHCEGNTLKIKKYRLTNQVVLVLKQDLFNLSGYTGSKINGVLGLEFFKDRIVRIDYGRHLLTLYDTAGFMVPQGYHAMPLIFDGSKMFLDLTVADSSGCERKVRVLIDTGAELAAWFRSFGKDPVPVPRKSIRGYIGKGLSGDIEGKLTRFDGIHLQDFKLHKPVVSFPDSATVAQIINQIDRDGTIGSQILCRFDLIFDAPHHMLYLKPNANYRKPFPYNMAGIEIVCMYGQLPIPEVLAVWQGSAAEEAGVRPGDLILDINGVSVFNTPLSEIRSQFEYHPGSRIKMTLSRKGESIQVSFRLRNDL